MEFDKIALIFVAGRKVLGAVSKGKDSAYFPGGKRERGETDEQTLIREVKEELSVDMIPGSIRPYGVFRAQAHGNPDGVMVKITCYTGQFHGTIRPSSEIERIEWLTSKDIPSVSPAGKLVLADLKAKDLIG